MEESRHWQSESELAAACSKGDAAACKDLYERYSAHMWSVCLRYAHNRMIAEDMFQEGFIRVFEKISSFKGQGSLEGWVRRLIINSALNFLQKHKRHIMDAEAGGLAEPWESSGAIEKLSAEEMTEMIQALPDGQRVVFNMFAIEGYSHREISEILDITENTSKSRMLRARLMLQNMIHRKTGKENNYERSRI